MTADDQRSCCTLNPVSRRMGNHLRTNKLLSLPSRCVISYQSRFSSLAIVTGYRYKWPSGPTDIQAAKEEMVINQSINQSIIF